MRTIIGRETEKQILADLLASEDPELVAVYGRRRVGKTFLIRSFYEKHLAFELIGSHDANLHEQLLGFSNALAKASGNRLPTPATWSEAFSLLELYLTPLLKEDKRVVFLDEFPWLHTPRSGFLSAFSHFWNSWGSMQPNLIVVLCGSSASWMIQRVLNDRGGLHNRVTQRIRLLPFTLGETQRFFEHRRVNLNHYQVTELYMAMGGIPQYLAAVKRGESSIQAINRICFTKDGFLHDEFNNLFESLFKNAGSHVEVIRALAKKPSGLTRNELIQVCNFNSGGGVTQVLDELTESGFISAYTPFNRRVKDNILKLTDEYSLFYIRFIEKQRGLDKDIWQRLSVGAAWQAWSGYAFESVCMKHIGLIKRGLGIEGVYTEQSVWRHTGTADGPGAQIDLLIDRQDKCINLCEIKFSEGEFVIDKKYTAQLDQKIAVFKAQTKTRKTIFPTLVTSYGAKKNNYYIGKIQAEITLKQLFQT